MAAATDAPAELVSLEAVAAQRQALETDTTLEEATKTLAAEALAEAERNLAAQQEWEAKIQEYESSRLAAPGLVEAIQEELKAPPAEPEILATEETPLVELEHLLNTAEADLGALRDSYERLSQEPARRNERRRAIPDLLLEAKKRLQAAQAPDAAGSSGAPALIAARKLAAQSMAQAAQREISAYEQELLNFDARNTLLTLLQDQANRNIAQADKLAKAYRDLVTQRRRKEAADAARQAREATVELLSAAPEVQGRIEAVAATNAALAEQRTGLNGLTRKIEDAVTLSGLRTPQVADLRAQFTSIQQRIQAGGLSDAVGILLRRYRSELPNQRALQQDIEKRSSTIADADIKKIDLREGRQLLGNLDQVVADALTDLPGSYSEEERAQISQNLRSLLQSQRELYAALISDYERYTAVLSDLNTKEKDLLATTELFEVYIDENILWTAGTPPLHPADLLYIVEACHWLILPAPWLELLRGFPRDMQGRPGIYMLAAILFTIVFITGRHSRKWLQELGGRARRSWHSSYVESIQALMITLVLTAPVPLLIGFVSWRITAAIQVNDHATAIASGLAACTVIYTTFSFLRHLFHPSGLVPAHFEWTTGRMEGMRHRISLFALISVPLVTVVNTLENQPNEEWKAAGGRFAYILLMLLVAVFAFRLLNNVFETMRAGQRKSWLGDRIHLQRLLLLLCTAVPVLMSIVAAFGYYYTALQLSERLFWTFTFVLTVMVAVAMLRRWLLITRRRLAIEQTRRKREALKAEADGSEKSEQPSIEEELDLVRVDAQTQSLVRAFFAFSVIIGVYFIWVDMLPALAVLESKELWHTRIQVEELVEQDGKLLPKLQDKLVPITWANMLFFGLIVVMTMVAVKNLPGLIEIALLERIKLGSGERYALLAVLRYVLVALGIVLAFKAVGIGWSNVQWLVAAVSLGLGFGLQEIFANFVSGLILLFERPIRVGDIVTVADHTGKVSRIRIRATTLVDWDRKERIIPNKEFVTGQLTNWTLSDTVLRIVIPVGIAYGSNTEKAHETLMSVCTGHREILADPEPMVVFNGFGASSLDFEVRAFTQNIDVYAATKHELHMDIDRACREAGIEIAFPQQDLHIRSGLEFLAPPQSSPGAARPE